MMELGVGRAAMLQALVQAGVRFVVVGGVAGIVHGSGRYTADLDIVYDSDPANLERLAGLLKAWEAYLRGVEAGLPWVLDARSLRISPVLTLTSRLGSIDVMDRIAGVGDFEAVREHSSEVSYAGVGFPVLDLDALIAAKRAAARPKDLADVVELEALYAKLHGREPPRVREPRRRPRRRRARGRA